MGEAKPAVTARGLAGYILGGGEVILPRERRAEAGNLACRWADETDRPHEGRCLRSQVATERREGRRGLRRDLAQLDDDVPIGVEVIAPSPVAAGDVLQH